MSRCRSIALLAYMLAFSLLSSPDVASGQDGEIIGGLLRDLIKSELQRRQQTPFQPFPNPPERNRPTDFDRNVRTVRVHCQSLANETGALLRAMESEATRHGGLHNHLDEVRKLQALATYAAQNLAQSPRESEVLAELAQLDAGWRLAKYHLQQVPNLPSSCSRYIERIDRLAQQICSPFGIQPQINRRELMRLFESLSAEMHHLERDIQFEAYRNPQARQIVAKLQSLETRARLLSDATFGGESYEEIVAEYGAFGEAWGVVAQQLYALNDVHINRTFEQISQIDQGIREQLWLPLPVDIPHISHVADATGEQIQLLLAEINIPILFTHPDSSLVMRRAAELDSAMRAFCECAVVGATQQELIRDWEQLDATWQAFDQQLTPIANGNVLAARQIAIAQLSDLRRALGIQLVFDRGQVIRYAAEIDGISDQLLFHVGQWRRRPGSNLSNETIRSVNEFASQCHQFRLDCERRQLDQDQLYRSCESLVREWQRVRSQLSVCDSPDRSSLMRVADTCTNSILHLSTLLRN